ncbi:MAG: isochorismate synthase [Actinomycetota bacterium]|nr:isochorismate synthase [Actinomycetota bacterium]MDQ6947283.1 isochorismate synthase [Actinomycetota bacterium]
MTWAVDAPSVTVAPVSQAPDVAAGLVARTVALPDDVDVDLVSVGGSVDALLWHREAFALAGRGVALRLMLPAGLDDPSAVASVLETLQAIPTTDDVGRPGCGPVVLAALPFDRSAPASLTIPAMTIGCDVTGRRWLTTVGPARAHFEALDTRSLDTRSLNTLSALPDYTPPDSFSLVSPRSHAEWAELVAATVSAVRSGRFDKVVLAREVTVVANRAFLPADILRRLHTLYPSCMVFSTGTFLGASPELLISRLGRRVRSHPLAGTVARSGDPTADAVLTGLLLGSDKEREEHRLVVDEVAAALRPVCRALDVPVVPSIVALRNVSHLGTVIEGELEGDHVTALELVSRLHPTPAVAGTPTASAVSYLASVEGFDRGCYAGPVGWMDRQGDGEWAVAVRSAEVRGNTARLFAGVGVVSDSDPAAELAETQLKLQALLAAVVRP